MALTKHVADKIHQVTDAFTNWFIVEDGGLTVVDTGFPRSWNSLQDALVEAEAAARGDRGGRADARALRPHGVRAARAGGARGAGVGSREGGSCGGAPVELRPRAAAPQVRP